MNKIEEYGIKAAQCDVIAENAASLVDREAGARAAEGWRSLQEEELLKCDRSITGKDLAWAAISLATWSMLSIWPGIEIAKGSSLTRAFGDLLLEMVALVLGVLAVCEIRDRIQK